MEACKARPAARALPASRGVRAPPNPRQPSYFLISMFQKAVTGASIMPVTFFRTATAPYH